MKIQSIENRSGTRHERQLDLRADRLEALVNLAFLMRHDIASRERLENYLQLLDRVLAGMAADELRTRIEIERQSA